MNTKFYIDTEGNDDNAYALAMQFACELSKKDSTVERIILYIHSKRNTGWFTRLYGSDIVKKLHKGLRFNDCPALFKFETKITYKNYEYGSSTDIVICCGIDSDDIFKIDDYDSCKYIIAIPWVKKSSKKWIKTWSAVEISGKENNEEYPEPSCIVKRALESLTSTINMSSGINHPMDNDRAKTYIKALHKYEPSLNSEIVGAYLVKTLNWSTQHAKDLLKLIDTLNNGRFFQGGEKTGLQKYYKRWKEDCKN